MPTPISVLLVEDVADDAEALLRELGRAGYAPAAERVETADEFRAALAAGPWDVILCDNSLSQFDAHAALEILKGVELDVPLIVVSGAVGEERAVELMRAGAADYVSKGKLARLAPAVERELREAAGRRERRQTARDLAAIVESSHDSIVGMDLDGTVTSYNGGAERMYGYRAAEIVGKKLHELLPPDHSAELRGVLERIRRGETVEPFESSRTRRDGIRIDVSVTVSPVRDDAGRVVGASSVTRNVTDIKLRERQLVESRRQFERTLDAVSDLFAAFDRDWNYTYLNRKAAAFTGHEPGDLVGKNVWELFPDMAGGTFHGELIAAAVSGECRQFEAYYPDRGRWYEHRAYPHHDGLSLFSSDITDRKDAERRLSRDTLILANVRDAVVVTDPDGVVAYWNDGAARLFGWTAAEVLRRRLFDLTPETERERADEVFRAVVAGREVHGEWQAWHKDGSRVWIDARVTRITDPDGNAVGVLGLSHDVTDRKRAEAVLREQDELLRTIIAHIPGGVFWKDRNSVLLGCNSKFASDLGFGDSRDVIGKTDAVLTPSAEAELFVARDRVVIETGEPLLDVEEQRTLPDGRTTTLLTSKVPLRGADGSVIGILGVYQDITDRKRAEDDLRASEERFRAFMNNSPSTAFIKDADGRYLYANPTWLSQFDTEPATWRGKTDYDFWPPVTAELFRASDRECLARNAVVKTEETGRTAEGKETTWLVMKFPILDGGEKRIGGMAWDITDRKNSETALRLSEERYRTLISATAAIVWVSLPSGEFNSEQPAWSAFTGQTADQFQGWGWLDAIHPGDQVHTTLAWTAAAAGRSRYTVEHRVRRWDGVYRHMQVRAEPIPEAGGGIREWVGVHTDVTEQKRTDQAIRLRDRAIDATTGGIIITDSSEPDDPIIYASPGFERLTGYTSSEVMGRNCRFLQGPDTDPAVVSELRSAIQAGREYSVEILNYRKDGTPFWNAVSVSPVRDDDGRLTHVVGVQTDVTGRRKLEEQFRHAQKMEAVGRLAGGVAHDFNNLLTIITGYGNLLLEDIPSDDPNRESVLEITKAGQRAADLTRQLLAFSRQTVLEPKVLDPNALIRDMQKMLRRLISEDVELTIKLAPDVGRVKVDPGQLEQAVVNLCVNARDAMPDGGELTIETYNVELDAAYAADHPDVRPGPYVLVAVGDTGTGMTPDVRARIFEPFFTTKEAGKGTGLGLAMVFGFVKQSGGHVGVESEPGRGSTFELFLPRLADATPTAKSGVKLGSMPRGKETILLVEDEQPVRALAARVLRSCGYTVLEAANGDAAVRTAAEAAMPIHLLLTDVVMPGGANGRQVAEAVVARFPYAKVLFCSGYTDDSVVRHGVLEEGAHFFQKPFTPAALAHKVRGVLDEWE